MRPLKGQFRIGSLASGGLIANIHCTSMCRHCLYLSSPRRSKKYIDDDTVVAMLQLIRRKKCRSVHIGGGEPLLRPERLARVLEIVAETGIYVDYIETNSRRKSAVFYTAREVTPPTTCSLGSSMNNRSCLNRAQASCLTF